MARSLMFYGASDDLFEIEGTKGNEPDEIGAYDKAVAVKVSNEHAGLYVMAVYAAANTGGCWTIGICPLDEDVPLPGWEMAWSAEGYSTVLRLTVPDDVIVSEAAA